MTSYDILTFSCLVHMDKGGNEFTEALSIGETAGYGDGVEAAFEFLDEAKLAHGHTPKSRVSPSEKRGILDRFGH